MRSRSIVTVVVGALVVGVGLASAGLPQRLNKTQWAAYQKQYTAFSGQTTRSVARFRSCLSKTTGSRNARAMQQCFGNTADLELAQTQKLNTVVRSFTKKTKGACDGTLGNYQQSLFFWQSTITGVNRAVHSNVANVATIQGNASHAQQIYPQLTAAAKAFSTACKPKV